MTSHPTRWTRCALTCVLAALLVCQLATFPAFGLTDQQKQQALAALKQQTLDNDPVLVNLSWGKLREALDSGKRLDMPVQERYGYVMRWSKQASTISNASNSELSAVMNELRRGVELGLSASPDDLALVKSRLLSAAEARLIKQKTMQATQDVLRASWKIADDSQKVHLVSVVAEHLNTWSGIRWQRQHIANVLGDIHAELANATAAPMRQADQQLVSALSEDPQWSAMVARRTILKFPDVMNESMLESIQAAIERANQANQLIELDTYADVADVLVRLQKTPLATSKQAGALAEMLVQTLDNQWIAEAPMETLGLIVQGTAPYLTDKTKEYLMKRAQEQFMALASIRRQVTKMEDLAPSNDIRAFQHICAALTESEEGETLYVESVLPWLELKQHEELYWVFYFGEYELIAKPIQTDDGRALLTHRLIDDQGAVRQPIASTLSYSYLQAGKLGTWLTYVNQQIDDAQDGDAKAQWLLIKSFIRAIECDSLPTPMAGVVEGENALLLATSDAVRLQCLERLVYACLASNNCPLAWYVIDEYAPRFTKSEGVTRLREEVKTVEQIVEPPTKRMLP